MNGIRLRYKLDIKCRYRVHLCRGQESPEYKITPLSYIQSVRILPSKNQVLVKVSITKSIQENELRDSEILTPTFVSGEQSLDEQVVLCRNV